MSRTLIQSWCRGETEAVTCFRNKGMKSFDVFFRALESRTANFPGLLPLLLLAAPKQRAGGWRRGLGRRGPVNIFTSGSYKSSPKNIFISLVAELPPEFVVKV